MGEGNIAISGDSVPTRVIADVSAEQTASSSPSRWALSLIERAFSFPAMLGVGLMACVFVRARMFFVDPDLWWHIKSGQNILATHHWPTTDPFSYTVAGQPWLAYEWLGDVLIASAAKMAGLQGLEMLLFVLGSAVVLALYAYGTLRSGSSKASAIAALLLSQLAFLNFNLRPQMLGYLFLVVLLILLERFRQGKTRSLWLAPALFLVWINTHGSWVIGMGTLFVYWMSGLMDFQMGGMIAKKWSVPEQRQISLVFLLSLAVLPLTPYGTELAAIPFRIGAAIPISEATIVEWFPMPFNEIGGKFFLVLLLAFFAVQIAYCLRWRLEELALWLFGTAMACIHVRFLLIFVPFFTPLLAITFALWVPRYSRGKDKYVLNVIIMACVAVAIFHYFPSRAYLEDKVSNAFPVRAVAYMREHPVPGPLFNNYGFGGYLLWTGQKVFIDGRSELYEQGGVLFDYMNIMLLKPGARGILRNYGIQSCMLDRKRDESLVTFLSALPEWKRIYADDLTIIFVRQGDGEKSLSSANRDGNRNDDE